MKKLIGIFAACLFSASVLATPGGYDINHKAEDGTGPYTYEIQCSETVFCLLGYDKTISTMQIQWWTPSAIRAKLGVDKTVVGTTVKYNTFRIYKNATVSSGVATFHLTSDGLSTGTALCTELFVDSIQPIVSDANASYQFSWAVTNSDKTITVTANKLTTSNILTGVLGQAQANGAVVKLVAECR